MLEMNRLSKVYRKEVVETHALRDFSIQVRQGEFVAVTGPSGSGKTTFLTIAGLLEEFTSGEYLLDGVNVTHMNDSQRSRLRNEKIGFIFQAFNLISDLDVAANVEVPLRYRKMGSAERRRRVADSLARVGLSARGKHFPAELSGGQQQRVAIARALAGSPRILLADEPTGNLDRALSIEVMDIFRDINASGTTVLMATHDQELITYVNRRVLQLHQGQLVGDRRPS